MGNTYRAAKNLVVLLAPQDKQADEAMQVSHLLKSVPFKKWLKKRWIRHDKIYRELGIPYIPQEHWEAFGAFAQRNWVFPSMDTTIYYNKPSWAVNLSYHMIDMNCPGVI